jgi:hypothetical protein
LESNMGWSQLSQLVETISGGDQNGKLVLNWF